MQKIVSILLLILVVYACEDKSNSISFTTKDSLNKIAANVAAFRNAAVYKEEQEQLERIRKLSGILALYDIKETPSDYELRLWLLPSMWDPSILYVLKSKDTTWTLFHYQYYTLGATGVTNYYSNPKVDSVALESVRPQKTNWQSYIANLYLDSLWGLQTESAIAGKDFGVVDGHRYLLEISRGNQYKYLYYTVPEHFQEKDINHKRFVDFKERLIKPIVYNGMRNP